MGLPVSKRLRSSAEFARVRSKGTSYPARFVVLNVLNLDEEPQLPTRCGFITTKKIGNAVQRNRVRRQLREIIRQTPLKEGCWLVTIARWRAVDATFAELKQDWRRAAKRAHILLAEAGTAVESP